MRCLALIALGVIIFLATPFPGVGQDKKPAAPEYPTEISGKSLDKWIEEISSKDRSKSERAIQTVVLFGPEAKKAIPRLTAELKKHVPGVSVLDMSVRTKGVVALGALIPYIPNAEDKQVQEAITEMVKMLDDPQLILRFRAIQAVSNLGPAANKAIPKLVGLSREISSWETRQMACVALGMIVPVDKDKGPLDANALSALYDRLDNDPAGQTRIAAIQSLNRLGAGHFPTTKTKFQNELEAAAKKDPDPLVRIRAHMSLMGANKKLDPARRTVIGDLLVNPDNLVRAEAATALGSIGPDAVDQLPNLVAGLRDRDPNIVILCIAALGRMERAGMDARPYLEKLSQDKMQPDPVRETAKESLEYIDGKKTFQKPLPPKGASK